MSDVPNTQIDLFLFTRQANLNLQSCRHDYFPNGVYSVRDWETPSEYAAATEPPQMYHPPHNSGATKQGRGLSPPYVAASAIVYCLPSNFKLNACLPKQNGFQSRSARLVEVAIQLSLLFLTTITRRRSRSYTAVILSPLLFVKSALRRPGVRVRSLKWIMDLIMRQCSRNKFQWLLRLIVKWTKRREVKNEEPSSIVGSICGAFGMQHGMICPPPVHRQNNCKSLRMILCIGYIQEEATLKRIRTRTKLIQIESVHSVYYRMESRRVVMVKQEERIIT